MLLILLRMAFKTASVFWSFGNRKRSNAIARATVKIFFGNIGSHRNAKLPAGRATTAHIVATMWGKRKNRTRHLSHRDMCQSSIMT